MLEQLIQSARLRLRDVFARRLSFRCGLLLVAVCSCGHAWAGEREARQALVDQFNAAFASSDFAGLEAGYASALREGTRLGSGIFVASEMAASIQFADPAPRSTQGGDGDRGRDDYWVPIERKAQAWAAQFPTSTLAAIALAKAYTGHAWQYRGTGWASSVRAEDWPMFHDYLNRARAALLDREAQGRKDPNWWAQLLFVATAQAWPADAFDRTAAAAMDAFPGHYSIYFAIIHRKVPKWGGSYQDMAAAADEAVRRTRVSDGESLYARVYWSAYPAMVETEPRMFARPDVDWPRIRASFDDLIARYPDAWNVNAYARLACVSAGDLETASRVLARPGFEVVPAVWKSFGEYQRCKRANTGAQR